MLKWLKDYSPHDSSGRNLVHAPLEEDNERLVGSVVLKSLEIVVLNLLTRELCM